MHYVTLSKAWSNTWQTERCRTFRYTPVQGSVSGDIGSQAGDCCLLSPPAPPPPPPCLSPPPPPPTHTHTHIPESSPQSSCSSHLFTTIYTAICMTGVQLFIRTIFFQWLHGQDLLRGIYIYMSKGHLPLCMSCIPVNDDADGEQMPPTHDTPVVIRQQ